MLGALLVVVVCCCLPSNAEHAIAVIGRVTQTTARVLYDYSGGDDTLDLVCSDSDDVSSHSEHYVVASGDAGYPTIIQIDVQPGSLHCIGLFRDSGVTIQFNMVSDDSSSGNEVTILSCNRYLQDGSNGMFPQVPRDSNVTLHIGDQVYMDQLHKMFLKDPKNNTAQQLIEHIRRAYRLAWGGGSSNVSNILRSNSNLMLPDDHDLLNNLGSKHRQNETLQLYLRSALQVFYEYQYALGEDVDYQFIASASVTAIVERYPIYNAFVSGQLHIIMLDTRFERSFGNGGPGTLLGSRQIQFLKDQLKTWKGKDVLVVSSVPLMMFSRTMARVVNLFEKEIYPNHPQLEEELRQVLEILFEHDGTITLIGGDMHHHHQANICSIHYDKCLKQYVTSGMTEGSTALRSFHLLMGYIITRIFSASISNDGPFLTFDKFYLGMNFLTVDSSMTISPILEQYTEQWMFLLQTIFDYAPLFVALMVMVIGVLLIVVCMGVARAFGTSNKVKSE